MEVSLVGCSQGKIGKNDLEIRELGFCKSNKQLIFSKNNQICFDLTKRWRRSGIQVAVRAANQSEALRSNKITEKTAAMKKRSKPEGGVELYVGLPLDGVSDCNTLNRARAISAGLKALKLLGLKGVEISVWWGIVEKEAMGKYDWSGYIALAKMVQEAGLKLRVSLCFHASKEPAISLPQWVSLIGESHPDIYFTDRSGRRCTECLSLAVDDLPVLDRKTPMQVYQGFLESFKSSFSALMGSTITDISIGLGPNGELRYPSHSPARSNRVSGVGEFQCYDKHMLDSLKQHAQAVGNPLWGLTGPHDAPTYYESPNSNTFFKENGGSWQTPYGHFFLSWYSYQLISHGDRLLSLASSTFCNSPVTISGKVPLVHYWYKVESHPSEMTAGFYNTSSRDGYNLIAEIFSKNLCKMILPGMDLSDAHQPSDSFSSPELLLSQIKTACGNHGVQISGENSSVSGTPDGFEKIKQNISGGNVTMDSFTYQRMGATFFSPKHFPLFSKFVRSLTQPELHPDDMPTDEGEKKSSVRKPVKDIRMQEA